MSSNNTLIFKNTLYLYIRQIVIMALSLVSTRIVLDKLGVEDYGIYNVIGGFVALFSIFNNVLFSATRRFLALAIGKGDSAEVRDTFNTSVVLHALIAVLVVVLLETVGFWALNYRLNIDASRMEAAHWVFQLSVANVFLLIMMTPYAAAVTAREKFNIYALISIFDVVAKIAILFLLVWLPYDKLKVYAVLMFVVAFVSRLIYRTYCNRNLEECRHVRLRVNKPLFREMLHFCGWDSLGNITSIANVQGVTVLLNIFFNAAVNASRGLASIVTSSISQFVTGFVQAAEPQLVKYYARKDMENFERLVFNIAQLTLFMLAIVAVPVWMEIEFVLRLWLGIIPEYTPEFIKITVLSCFISYSNTMLLKANVAAGQVKWVTLYMAPVGLIHLPLVYLVLKLGWNPVAVYWVGAVPIFLRMFIDLYILRRYVGFPSAKYFFKVFLKNLFLVGLACILPYLLRERMDAGWLRFFVVCSVSVTCTAVLMWCFALEKATRALLVDRIKQKLPFLRSI